MVAAKTSGMMMDARNPKEGMKMKDLLTKRIVELQGLLDLVQNECSDAIEAAANVIIECYQNKGGVFVFGNGGSAADAQHIVGELNGRFLFDRPGLRAQSLVGDGATMTCVSNDYGYEHIFSRQLQSNAVAGDVAWGLSTSGNSPNVVKAFEYAKGAGIKTIALTGGDGGKCADLADVLIAIPSTFTPHIQEAGVVVYHCICEQVERVLFQR
jgi:D-sedoheptulose 7-phosphate isomerase